MASRLAVEGLDVEDGNQILLAESDEQFVDTVVHLLNNPEQRAALAPAPEPGLAPILVGKGPLRRMRRFMTI